MRPADLGLFLLLGLLLFPPFPASLFGRCREGFLPGNGIIAPSVRSHSRPVEANAACLANTLTTDAISGTSFESGETVSVPFTGTGTYTGNTFTAELSNSAGSFASPITIGTWVSDVSGSISAQIPCGTPAGTGYRIRVIASNPAITGSDNGTNLTITEDLTPPTLTCLPASTAFLIHKEYARLTLTITNIAVTQNADCDGFLSGDSDFEWNWDAGNTLTLGAPQGYHLVSGNNGPYAVTLSSQLLQEDYELTSLPATLDFQWRAFESDGPSEPALSFNGGTAISTASLAVPSGDGATNQTFTLSSLDGGCPQTYQISAQLNRAALPYTYQAEIVPVLEASATDACGPVVITASQTIFTCAEVGPNTITVTATDLHGNTATCSKTVIVVDNTPPVAVAQPATVILDATGTGSVTGAQINDGSTDACGIASASVFPNTFTCANIGANIVTLTVTDAGGNSSTATTTVTVTDNMPPVLALTGSSTVTVCQGSPYTDAGATFLDNCAIAGSIAVVNPVNTAVAGTYAVTYNASDVAGNVAAQVTRTVQVNEVMPGSIAGNQMIVPGGDPVAFTQTAASGSGTLSYGWESSLVSGSGFSAIAPPATGMTYDVPGGLTQTTYFRRVATSTQGGVGCSAVSNEVMVAAGKPAIAVRNAGNTLAIPSGNNPPDAATGTLLEPLGSSGVATVSFTISNEAGTQPLNISDISLSGGGAACFAIVAAPGSPIAAGATGMLVLRYTAMGTGARSATVTILSDDSSEATYTFRVQGSSTAAACN